MIQHNAAAQALRQLLAAQRIRRELGRELQALAAQMAARMRLRAPKFRSTLTNSIRAEQRGELDYFVGPTIEPRVALAIERGRKPGKGLPPFFSAESASAVAWLQTKLGATSLAGPFNPRWRTARVGTRRRTQAELDLRDRYMGWSRSVKARGIPASPFVRPTADEFRAAVPARLIAAVRRGASGGAA